jgi:hypothetical protein
MAGTQHISMLFSQLLLAATWNQHDVHHLKPKATLMKI